MPTSVELHAWHDFVTDAASYGGNPFDVTATVSWAHEDGTTVRTGHAFWTGTGDDYAFRFGASKLGLWTGTTTSAVTELDGLTLEVEVIAPTNPKRAGFHIEHPTEATAWAQMYGPDASPRIRPPRLAMTGDPREWWNDLPGMRARAASFAEGHGFTGAAINVMARVWYDVEATTLEVDGFSGDPDPRTFTAFEELIDEWLDHAGMVWIWAWGKSVDFRKDGFKDLTGGNTGDTYLRLGRYITARLGPVPGWGMAIGFDTTAWLTEADTAAWLDEWDFGGHLHWLSSRYREEIEDSAYTERPTETNRGEYTAAGISWNGVRGPAPYLASWEQWTTYTSDADLDQGLVEFPDRPMFSEDRFRMNNSWPDKDYAEEADILTDITRFGVRGIGAIYGKLPESGDQEVTSEDWSNAGDILSANTLVDAEWHEEEVDRRFLDSVDGTGGRLLEGMSDAAPTDLAPGDLDHGQTTGASGLTQAHQLSPAGLEHAQEAGASALTQASELSPGGVDHLQASGAAGLDQDHDIVTGDLSHAHEAGEAGLTQVHGLEAGELAHSQDLGAAPLGQVHEIEPAGLQHGHSLDAPELTEAHDLAPGSVDHGHHAAPVALDQVHELVPGSLEHGQLIGPSEVVVAYLLSPDGLLHAHTLDPLAVAEAHALSPLGLVHGVTVEGADFSQVHGLESGDLEHGQELGSGMLSAGLLLVPAGLLNTQEIGPLELTQAHDLGVSELDQAQGLDSLDLTQAHELDVGEIDHGHELGATEMASGLLLTPAGLVHGQGLGGTGLTQAHGLSPAGLDHVEELGPVTLAVVVALSPGGIAHLQTLDGVEIAIEAEVHSLQPGALVHVQEVDASQLQQGHELAAGGLVHGHTLGSSELIPETPPPSLHLRIAPRTTLVRIAPRRVALSISPRTTLQHLDRS